MPSIQRQYLDKKIEIIQADKPFKYKSNINSKQPTFLH